MSISYKVQKGDTLYAIAKRHGIKRWQELYDHPDNTDFRKKRPDPNLIYPGDVVMIPGSVADPVSTQAPQTAGIAAGKQFRLIDEDRGTERYITADSKEFIEKYIDKNIVKVTSDPHPRTAEHHTMVVRYRSGRTLEIPLNDVPVRVKLSVPDTPGMRHVRIGPFSHPMVDLYLLRGGFIFPADYKKRILYLDENTPNIIDARTTIEFNIRQRRTLLQLAELTAAFAGLIGLSASVHSLGVGLTAEPAGGWSVSRSVPQKAPPPLREPPDATFRISKQYKQVKTAEMLMWEREGGHTLQRHNWQLTRRQLYERIAGETEIAPSQGKAGSGGTQSADFRVWEGKTGVGAASKWRDEQTMNKAIAEVIHKNIDEIRRGTTGGQEWSRERYALGYKTGEGWVTTRGAPKAERGVFWDDNLNGITIVIRPRQNHIPSKADPEGWYVHTAYPQKTK